MPTTTPIHRRKQPSRATLLSVCHLGANAAPNQRWTDIWSAGHSVSGVRAAPTVAELVDALGRAYRGSATA